MSDNHRVGLIEALAEYDPSLNTKYILYGAFSFFVSCNIIFAIILLYCYEEYEYDVLKEIFYSRDFENIFYMHVLDYAGLVLLETLLLPFLAWRAAVSGQIIDDISSLQKSSSSCCCFRCCYRGGSTSPDDHYTSLNSETNDEENKYTLRGYEDADLAKQLDNKATDSKYLMARKSAERRKSLWISFLFLASTAVQVSVTSICRTYTRFSSLTFLNGVGIYWNEVHIFQFPCRVS